MSLRKRAALGFDDESSDSEIEETSKVIYKHKPKLPKLSFKTEEIKPKDIDDVRPSLGKAEDPVDQDKTKDEDDYMKMVIPENEFTGPQRLSKDDSKAKPGYNFDDIHDKKQKKETTSLFGQLHNNTSTRDAIQQIPNSQLKNSSKGLSIMEKMGFKVGDTLGKDSKNENALLEPIQVLQREDRSGIKEKELELKQQGQQKLSEGITNEDAQKYRERLNNEQNEQRKEKILHRMQKYCWEFSGDCEAPDIEKVEPLGINVLWRGYVKFIQKLLKDKKKQQRIKDPEELQGAVEDEDKKGEEEEEKEEEDEELELFNEMTLDEKLSKVHIFLRAEFNYCYYCGAKYEDQQDLYEHCPGLNEEEHS